MSRTLQSAFIEFCSFGAGQKGGGSEMDGRTLVKLAKDCKIKVTRTDVDLTFTKCKSKGSRKITFSQFQDCLAEFAKRTKTSVGTLEQQIINAKGPASSGTKADKVKFHDDKSLYTGVHAKGGPSTNDNKITLSNLMNRGATDVRGRQVGKAESSARPRRTTPSSPSTTPKSPGAPKKTAGATTRSPGRKKPTASAPSSAAAGADAGTGSVEDLCKVFNKFCDFGSGGRGANGQLTGRNFTKLCKDSGLVKRGFTVTDTDLIFTSCKRKGERTIDFKSFHDKVLPAIATKKKSSVEGIAQIITGAKAGLTGVSKAEKVKFHDDKSLYTGVHAKGGPSTKDNKITLSNLMDRSATDIRGRKF